MVDHAPTVLWSAPSRSAAGAADRDPSAELVSTHLYLIQHVVNQLAARYPRHVDRGELWNAGAVGLVEAAGRFDPTTGVPFASFATLRIRGAILDAARSADFATRAVRRDAREVERAAEDFERRHGRTATQEELADALGISVSELDARRAAAAVGHVLHLDQPVAGDDGPATLGDTVADTLGPLPEVAVEQREMVGTLRAALPYLDETQASVLRRHYFEGEMLRDIAASMGVTEARVSQLHTEAVNALRAYFATEFDGVPAVEPSAPGVRRRAAFTAIVSERVTAQVRWAAADGRPVRRAHVARA